MQEVLSVKFECTSDTTIIIGDCASNLPEDEILRLATDAFRARLRSKDVLEFLGVKAELQRHSFDDPSRPQMP